MGTLIEGLTEGRIVHYVLEGKGDHRPAIVVRDWKQENGLVNLQVFTDGWNDGLETSFVVMNGKEQVGIVKQIDLTVWRTSVHYSEAKEPGTWHWPERA
jgi:hypothetical protein